MYTWEVFWQLFLVVAIESAIVSSICLSLWFGCAYLLGMLNTSISDTKLIRPIEREWEKAREPVPAEVSSAPV